MNDPNTVPFIIILSIDHPPWFRVEGRFDQADGDTKVRYVVTGAPAQAVELYDDAKAFARHHHGTISIFDTESKATKFTVTIPIVPEPDELKLISPAGTFFLVNAGRLF